MKITWNNYKSSIKVNLYVLTNFQMKIIMINLIKKN